MALDKNKSSDKAADKAAPSSNAKAARPATPMSRQRRWLVFGVNVVVALLLATTLMVAAIWLADVGLRGKARVDWTATGRFSLSPRTKAVLADLPCKVTITNLYLHSPKFPDSEVRFQRVKDLLEEYSMAAPDKITTETIDRRTNPVAMKALVARLKEPYTKELADAKQVADKFLLLNDEVLTVLNGEQRKLAEAANTVGLALEVAKARQAEAAKTPSGTAAEPAKTPTGTPAAAAADEEYYKSAGELLDIANNWTLCIVSGQQVADDFEKKTAQQDLPEYIAPLTEARQFLKVIGASLDGVEAQFLRVQADMPKGVALPDSVKKLIDAAPTTYAPIRRKMTEFEKEASLIKETGLDRIARDIEAGDAILIESPSRAKVVAFDDVWVPNRAARSNPEDEDAAIPRLFAGETALTSTLMGLCNTKRPAVIFVSAGGPVTVYGGPYSRLAERLGKMNFLVMDWNVMLQPEMPKPDNVSMTVLVFVPPPPQQQQDPRMPPPSPEQYRAAMAAVAAGAPTILLGQPAESMQGPVPYADLFPLFGVDAKWGATVVRSRLADADTGREASSPQVEVTAYVEHAITQTMGALPSMFLDSMPLAIQSEPPPDVTDQPLVFMPDRSDCWADMARDRVKKGVAKHDPSETLAGVLPLAVAATRKTATGDQKAVLFGSPSIALDYVSYATDNRDVLLFPGNGELFINSLLWMSGSEHLITVSPEALQARRLGDPGAWLLPLRIMIIAGLPALVLIAGIVVYLVRRG